MKLPGKDVPIQPWHGIKGLAGILVFLEEPVILLPRSMNCIVRQVQIERFAIIDCFVHRLGVGGRAPGDADDPRHPVLGLEQGDQVFPALIGSLLPTGLVGLVLAALIAALMSSIDSTLNSAATLVTLDFIKPLRPQLTSRQTAWIGRTAIMVFMVLAALVAPVIGSFEGLFHYLQTALAFLVPPVVVIFLFGLFWPRAGAGAALATLLGGHAVSALCFVATLTGWLDLHFTYIAGLIFAVSSVIFWVAGQLTAPPLPQQVDRFTYRPAIMARTEPGPWWQDYRVHAAVLLLLTLWLVVAFW